MTLAEYVDGLAKAGTIDGNIAELIMSYHRKESKVPCAAIRDALMPIVAEMDEYHGRCAVEVQFAHDKFWDTHEPQTIGDFSDRITDAVANLCGEIATREVHERYKKTLPVDVGLARVALERAECVLLCAARFAEDNAFDDAFARANLKDVDWDGALKSIRAVLAKPPREVDVGTPEEQSARFDDHCVRHMGCTTCPIRNEGGSVPKHCEFNWGQQAYRKSL